MFEFLKDGNWIWPNWVDIVEPDVGYFDQSTGEIEVDPTVLKTVSLLQAMLFLQMGYALGAELKISIFHFSEYF